MSSAFSLSRAPLLLLGIAFVLFAAPPAATSEDAQSNPIYLWELASNDAEASVAFMKNVFGWEIELDESSGIYYAPAGEARSEFYGGTIFTLQEAKLPFLTVFIKVTDLAGKMKLIEEFGGHIVEGPIETPGGHGLCLFNEPSGVTFAMIELRPKD